METPRAKTYGEPQLFYRDDPDSLAAYRRAQEERWAIDAALYDTLKRTDLTPDQASAEVSRLYALKDELPPIALRDHPPRQRAEQAHQGPRPEERQRYSRFGSAAMHGNQHASQSSNSMHATPEGYSAGPGGRITPNIPPEMHIPQAPAQQVGHRTITPIPQGSGMNGSGEQTSQSLPTKDATWRYDSAE